MSTKIPTSILAEYKGLPRFTIAEIIVLALQDEIVESPLALPSQESNKNKNNNNASVDSGPENAKIDINHFFQAPILDITLLTPDTRDINTVLQVDVDVSQRPELQSWMPGDAFGILCPNREEWIEIVMERLGLKEHDLSVSVIQHNTKPLLTTLSRISCPQTQSSDSKNTWNFKLSDFFRLCGALHFVPKKKLFRVLAEYCPQDSVDQHKLLHLCSTNGSAEYRKNWLTPKSPSLLQLFEAFPEFRFSPWSKQSEVERKSFFEFLGHFLEALPPLAPRYYSCSTSSRHPMSKNGTIVSFAIWLLENGHNSLHFERLWKNQRDSSLLEKQVQRLSLTASLPSQTALKLPIFLRPSTFVIPSDMDGPIILAGGIVPFRVFLQDRENYLNQNKDKIISNETWLFYGCRYKERDFLYGKELAHFCETKTLTHFFPVFSRDGPSKVYIQDIIQSTAVRSNLVNALLDPKSHIFLCSDTKGVGAAIYAAFVTILDEDHFHNKEAAAQLLQEKKSKKMYLVDDWG